MQILGLASALPAVVAESAERLGIQIKVHCSRLAVRLPAATELAIYRVLQEALLNVERHARARHVRVTLKRRAAIVQLTIQDDGIGFDTSVQPTSGPQREHFGLLSTRERATAVGGSLRVNSTHEAGTQVRFDMPIRASVA